MDIKKFMERYDNYPVVFCGTGLSMRYCSNILSWDKLLDKVMYEIYGTDEEYLALKSKHILNDIVDYPSIGLEIEKIFNEFCNGEGKEKFSDINEIFYNSIRNNVNISRFKLYISYILKELEFKDDKIEELENLKICTKNISAFITTNYDVFLEKNTDFEVLVGNDIILKNNYGVIYKIHGCCEKPEQIIVTSDDYNKFEKDYELIRAQLITFFISNPIIFLGYGIGDSNILNILNTIFLYIKPNSEEANKIKNNFLIIEYEKGNMNENIEDYDIKVENSLIRIKKLRTDNFNAIYEAINNLELPVSVMDIKKVQNIIKDIKFNPLSSMEVQIASDIDNFKNSEKVLYIGTKESIQYKHVKNIYYFKNYVDILENNNKSMINTIHELDIAVTQYFPVCGFIKILSSKHERMEELKQQQIELLNNNISKLDNKCANYNYISIKDIFDDDSISRSNKDGYILYGIMKDKILLDEVVEFIKDNVEQRYKDSPFKKIICAYDYKKYNK